MTALGVQFRGLEVPPRLRLIVRDSAKCAWATKDRSHRNMKYPTFSFACGDDTGFVVVAHVDTLIACCWGWRICGEIVALGRCLTGWADAIPSVVRRHV